MRILKVIIVVIFGTISAKAQPARKLVPLTTQDVPRSILGEIGAVIEEPGEAGTKGVGVPFIFPEDTSKADLSGAKYIYGIDLSHHNFGKGVNYDLPSLERKGVSFVYLKASQGERFFDRTFRANWKNISISKGGYHFLTANDDPASQAENFIQMLSSAGYKPKRDLPPVIDIEWDCTAVVNGRCLHDKWSDVSAAEIIQKVSSASEIIQKRFGVTPVFYTNHNWLQSVGIANSSFIKGAKLWINDFTKKARQAGKPASPAGVAPLLWQFTENGKLIESCDPYSLKSLCADTNRASLSLEEFKAVMNK